MKSPSPEQRSELLSTRQHQKMSRSAQTFVRGSTARFYQWLAERGEGLPDGPVVWICGDCHYGNLGPVANSAGEVEIQIRDLDQTVIGNPAHDLIRLAFSLASAARGFDLPGLATAELVEQAVEGYQSALLDPDQSGHRPPLIKGLLQTSKRRRWRHLARERLDDPRPEIPLGKRFWRLAPAERKALAALVGEAGVNALLTSLTRRPDDAKVELVDAAYWVKGCSSLGLMRYALLVGIASDAGGEHALIDVKEAIKPAAPRAADATMPRDNAERVVEGARQLSPYLGSRMAAARLLERPVFVRELLPQDLKLEISALAAKEAAVMARFLAGVVGRAHARQMSVSDRKLWAEDLGRRRSRTLDAPSWLWNSVTELMGAHESAYLEHCRRYARIAA